LEAAELLCLEKVEELQNISVSRNPETKCINSIAHCLRDQLRLSSKVFKVYLIAADESAFVEVTGQVTVSLCSCN
jgi:hypothetical protein